MDTLLSNFDISMSYDSQHYASNDSGLSSNSNGAIENESKSTSYVDFHCDDLTKSLFINSIGGNELIHDDDIYSYKYKVEIENMFNNKFRSFNFPKSDNCFKIKNSGSFSSIIQDLENLKESEPLYKYPTNIPSANITMKDKSTNISKLQPNISTNGKPNEDYLCDMKYEHLERMKIKKPIKKPRQQNNSNIQEYLSSSIKNYKGNQSVNELVEFIQGTPSNSKQNSNCKSKPDKNVTNQKKSPELSDYIDSGTSEQGSPIGKEIIANNTVIIDGDSGTQSHFVSLNNSDEDTTQTIVINDFQEVLPKSRKKQKKTNNNFESNNNNNNNSNNNNLSSSTKQSVNSKSSVKSSKSNRKCNSKAKTVKDDRVLVNTCIDLLDSKDSLRRFLSDQFSSFMKLSIMVS